MSNPNFFQQLLAKLTEKDYVAVIELLAQLNSYESVRKAPFHSNTVDAAYIGENNSFLLVKFDFLNDTDSSKAWLADEKIFNGDKPLYFSESSNRVSPVYGLNCVKSFLKGIHPDAEVDMLLVTNYSFVNYRDMVEDWGNIGVKVVYGVDTSRFSAFTAAEPQDSLFTKDDFDRLLDEFIDSQLNDDKNDNKKQKKETTVNEQDRKSNQMIEPGQFSVQTIHLYRGDLYGRPKSDVQPLCTFDMRRLDAVSLLFEAYYTSRKVQGDEFDINLYNETGQLLSRSKVLGSFCAMEDGMIVNFVCPLRPGDNAEWVCGNYLIEVKYCGELVIPVTFTVGRRNIRGAFKSDSNYDITHPFDTLDRMVGLREVKEQMVEYRNMVSLAMRRQDSGLTATHPPLHAIFMGNPGTGKTTVARIYGTMLNQLGLLSSGHVVVRERSTLMGQNYASEQELTRQAIEEARGGVLFIDEAYNLYNSNDPRDPGRNVIETLLTLLGDERERDIALLLAGYPGGMASLISFNQGLDSRIPASNRYRFPDYSVDELMQIADSYCAANSYFMTTEARKSLRCKVSYDFRLRDEKFGNARYITALMTSQVLPAMASRLAGRRTLSLFDMITIQKDDIPALRLKDYSPSLKKLRDMVGLGELKKSIESHLNMVKFMIMRNEQGIETALPPLHMIFTGNPGTGKTTVASFIGEIYASLGLLSKGDVVYVERKDIVGQHIGDTEKNMTDILNRAKGNVLFIDEAYTLVSDDSNSDFGYRALEVLLSTLSRESVDMLVIMAGYPKEMDDMLRSNKGLRSRIPYTFHFVDYTADELMQIADMVVRKSKFTFSPAARRKLRTLVDERLAAGESSWGNARFITRLISTQVLPAMSNRLSLLAADKRRDKKRLTLICDEDIPSVGFEIMDSAMSFDDETISRVLKKLDALVGLKDVKRNIHDFVKVARYIHSHGGSYADNELLRWNFIGNTGTGKSTVAKIMAELLKAMNLIEKGHVIEIKAEEMYGVAAYKVDEVLMKAMKHSNQGLLFIDGDAPMFKHPDSPFSAETMRFKFISMTMELPGTYALVIAENDGPSHTLIRNLRQSGISSFDHTLHFADYNELELLAILEICLKRKRLVLSSEASAHMTTYIHSLYENRELGYANARTMSKLSHAIAENHMLRTCSDTTTCKGLVTLADVEKFIWHVTNSRKIGYVK